MAPALHGNTHLEPPTCNIQKPMTIVHPAVGVACFPNRILVTHSFILIASRGWTRHPNPSATLCVQHLLYAAQSPSQQFPLLPCAALLQQEQPSDQWVHRSPCLMRHESRDGL